AAAKQNSHLESKRKERQSTPSDGLNKSESQSHASLSDMDSLQLEWDFDFESGYDYYDSQAASHSEPKYKRQSPMKDKLSSTETGFDVPMTDEQKLKMHDLLDEAKKLGLLNNIIDALAPSESTHNQL